MFKVDGHTRVAEHNDIKIGAVLRSISPSEGVAWAFGDSIVSDFMALAGEVEVTLARPHMIANPNTGGWYVHVEVFKVPIAKLCGEGSMFRIVLLSTGEPARHVTG